MKQRQAPGRRALQSIGNGLHLLERGVAVYHGLRGIAATGAAIAEAAAPLMVAL